MKKLKILSQKLPATEARCLSIPPLCVEKKPVLLARRFLAGQCPDGTQVHPDDVRRLGRLLGRPGPPQCRPGRLLGRPGPPAILITDDANPNPNPKSKGTEP